MVTKAATQADLVTIPLVRIPAPRAPIYEMTRMNPGNNQLLQSGAAASAHLCGMPFPVNGHARVRGLLMGFPLGAFPTGK